LNFSALKIGGTVSYCLIFIVSLVANSLIVMIVYKMPNLRKPINFFIANMASSDLLYPIFWIPWYLSHLHTNSFPIGGKVGLALCKLVPFFSDVSFVVSIQNLILIAVDRFGAVVFPLRSPLIRSKLCPSFILATWIVAVAVNSPYLFTRELVEYPEGTWCVIEWKKAFGESSSHASFLLAYQILFKCIPVLLLVILHSIIVIKLKTQAHPGTRGTLVNKKSPRLLLVCFLNFSALKIGGTVSYCLIFIVSLVANSLIVMIVYKTPNLRKPINFFIANMASSDLLYPIFWIPWYLSHLHTNSFPIGGKVGQALCKLVPFFSDVSFVVSIQNLILIAVDRFGAVVFPLRSPLIGSKLCPFFILATWIVAVAVNSPYLFTFELVEYLEGTGCVIEWEKAFGESSSFESFLLAYISLFIYIPVLLLVILYSIIVIKLKTQVHPGE
ncbi:unnamed protein product, partial [Porites lobata]